MTDLPHPIYPVKVFGPFLRGKKGANRVYQIRWRWNPPTSLPEPERNALMALKWESTGTTDRRQAERIMIDRDRELNDIAYWSRHYADKRAAAAPAIVPLDTAIAQAWESYIAFEGATANPITISNRRCAWLKLAEYLRDVRPDVKDLAAVTPLLGAEFRNWLTKPKVEKAPALGNGCGLKTANNYCTDLGTIWRALVKIGFAAGNPWEDVKRYKKADVRASTRKPIALDCEQAEAFLAAAGRIDVYYPGVLLYVSLMLRAGMRHGETEAALGDWIKTTPRGVSLVMPSRQEQENGYLFRPKNRLGRVVPLHADIVALLKARPTHPKAHLVMPERLWSSPSSRWRIGHRRFWEDLVREAKAPEGLHPHDLRHSFITECHRKGIPHVKIMQAVGHQDLSVHLDYTHLDDYDPFVEETFSFG